MAPSGLADGTEGEAYRSPLADTSSQNRPLGVSWEIGVCLLGGLAPMGDGLGIPNPRNVAARRRLVARR